MYVYWLPQLIFSYMYYDIIVYHITTSCIRISSPLLTHFSYYITTLTVPLVCKCIGYHVAYFFFYDNEVESAIADWTTCVFHHYDGVNDDSWVNQCGIIPKNHASSTAAIWYVFCLSGHSFVLATIYLPSMFAIW